MGNVHEVALAEAFKTSLGDDFTVTTRKELDVENLPDVGILMGVKGKGSNAADVLMRTLLDNGKHFIYIDKGYFRSRQKNTEVMDYYRFSVDAFQPLRYLQRIPHPSDRWDQLPLRVAEPKLNFGDGTIVFCGSSQKYCDLKGLGDATEYAKNIIYKLRSIDRYGRKIVYRPKPSWKDAVEIHGTQYSADTRHLSTELKKADVVVTNGSNACFEAALAGVPSIVLGDGITLSLGSNKLKTVNHLQPLVRSDVEQLCFDIAYQQWTPGEVASGEAINYFNLIFEYLESV